MSQDLQDGLVYCLVDGVIYGDPYNYLGGITTKALRSGEDGPFFYEAEVTCGLSPRTYERFAE